MYVCICHDLSMRWTFRYYYNALARARAHNARARAATANPPSLAVAEHLAQQLTPPLSRCSTCVRANAHVRTNRAPRRGQKTTTCPRENHIHDGVATMRTITTTTMTTLTTTTTTTTGNHNDVDDHSDGRRRQKTVAQLQPPRANRGQAEDRQRPSGEHAGTKRGRSEGQTGNQRGPNGEPTGVNRPPKGKTTKCGKR